MSRLYRHYLAQHWLTVSIVVVGFGLTAAVTWAESSQSMQAAEEIMDRRALVVTEAVRESVLDALGDASGSAGLFAASGEVTEAQFERFLESVGHSWRARFGVYSFAIPIGTVAVPNWGLGVRSCYGLFRFDGHGDRVPVDSQGTSYPVRFFVPAPGSDFDLAGFDGNSDPAWVEALERAEATTSIAVSRLNQLFGVPGQWGFLVAAPIKQAEKVTGFTVSVVRLDSLVEADLAHSLSEVVIWDVRDVTVGVASLVSPDPFRRSETLELGGRIWRVAGATAGSC